MGPLDLENSLAGGPGGSQRADNTELAGVAIKTVGGVEVLHDHHLEACGTTLARGDCGPGKEECTPLCFNAAQLV